MPKSKIRGPHAYDPEHCSGCLADEQRYDLPESAGPREGPLPVGITRSSPFVAMNVRPSQVQHAEPPDPRTVLETADAPGYQTTSLIPAKQKRTDYLHDGPIRSESMGTDTSG